MVEAFNTLEENYALGVICVREVCLCRHIGFAKNRRREKI